MTYPATGFCNFLSVKSGFYGNICPIFAYPLKAEKYTPLSQSAGVFANGLPSEVPHPCYCRAFLCPLVSSFSRLFVSLGGAGANDTTA
ncbi:hypothetical protein [Nostoc punctiforme]|uniref:hypothetical protein n=1 Tax=Nostoc punctiforme TaxID=272131 RepID=UPI001427ACC3|nr:hypothetical protein [Nostoc punctiforme]